MGSSCFLCIVLFTAMRIAYTRVPLEYQWVVLIVFQGLKFLFTRMVYYAAENGKNPDAICLFIFALEALTQLSENFLFLSTDGVGTIVLFVAAGSWPLTSRYTPGTQFGSCFRCRSIAAAC